MKKYAIIVAGGKGVRMGTDIPKQFLLLSGKPVLMHTLTAFHSCNTNIKLILVLPSDQITIWQSLIEKYDFSIDHQIVQGGETRFDSVQNGLNSISSDGLVAIHDGVRPLVSTKVIEASYQGAEKFGNAIASVELKESIREINADESFSRNRANFRLMQTPQTFKMSLIKKAFENATNNAFTDDAGVLEHDGGKINLIQGNYSNIKLTTEEDLIIAEGLIRA